uniref:SWIB domain-containing protein n=1 Tax=Kwoniella dejecticola CBS 10117 TaxID=1296121 RepID=A0A1A5ZXE8_9TREE|nr:uncharacterized protein I303_07241 [Kwoniella dejecticola CBS 10117]OBR82481.1 hypothetical protein I303_07241 [Kwoniella dejecticola CBS 10117]
MSVAQAGPSHAPNISQTPSYPQQSGQGDNKRRAEGDADSVRRLKHPRPPLPPPHVLQALVPDSPAFTELIKLEQKLDWTILRKKAEINDTFGKPTRVKRTLRVYISNTAHDQPWQKSESQAEANAASAPNAESAENANSSEEKNETGVDVNTGKGIAGWVMKIEGRLLDFGNTRLDRTKRKFSTFLKSVIVEFDNREAPTFPEGNIVEWHAQNTTPPLDGFEILRRGDQNVNARIIIHLSHSPDRFKVLQPLADLISIKEGTRSEIINGVWKLIKVVGAQDRDDGTVIKAVGGLEKIFPQGTEPIAFHQIPEMATRFLTHPDPIVIPYTIQVDKDFNFHPKCFDIPFEVEDPLKSKMSSLVQSFEGKEGKEIVQLEDKVGELAYFARDVKQKRDFLESFAANPQAFIQNWLAVQARDLDQMLGYQIGAPGLNGGNIREEDLRRSDLFSLPWVDEAVTVHESARMEQERRLKGSQAQAHR